MQFISVSSGCAGVSCAILIFVNWFVCLNVSVEPL